VSELGLAGENLTMLVISRDSLIQQKVSPHNMHQSPQNDFCRTKTCSNVFTQPGSFTKVGRDPLVPQMSASHQ